LPFPQNQNFTGRKDEIDALEHELFVDRSCQKTAVVGLGGVGKTQVALQFAYMALKKHLDVSVFWVPAMSSETFEQACREVAGVLGILRAEDGEEDVKELVRLHLSTEKAGKWLLIVDNADDIGVLESSGGEKGILDHLPTSELGLTVFTTRDWKTASRLAGNNIVCVDKLDPRTASNLFKASMRPDLSYNETVADKLLVELNCLPLAITQAAAYINCNAVSVEEYLNHVEDTEPNLIYIISEEMGDHTRYKHHAGSAVAKTWLVSFDQIVRQDVDAANLLQYMSCVEWKAIPRSILPAMEPEARMTTAIGTLCSYSFITIRNDRKTYDMHRLVHIAAKVWVQQKGLMVEMQKTALEHLSNIFPSDDYENREVWREYIPHAARMRNARNDRYSDVGGELCLQVGRCLRVDGRMRDAIDWLEKSRDLRSDLSENHAGRLLTQHVLAMAYRANGLISEAVELLEQVVAIHKQVLAKDHPNRLASQHELASAYQANGQIIKGARLIGQVVAIREQVLVEDHPHRLTSQHELASAYQATGQVKEAVRLLEHVVAIRERVLAEDHPDRLTSQQLLASAYWANRQVKEAVRLLEHVSTIREQVLAEDHPSRLTSQHELASAYKADKQPYQLGSRPLTQADEHEVGPSGAWRLAREPEKSLPYRSQVFGAPFHDGFSDVMHKKEGARGNFTRLWQKLKGRK
jgi:tetratricopeptide (TPR) repeat protein